MFSWSATFSLGTQVPSQRSPEEMVSHTLMQELGALLKHTERLCQGRAAATHRRTSCVDYSWLAVTPQKPSYELTPGELLELQELCAKIPPSHCGPVILRLRKLITELEPEVAEVSRLFRLVLCDCLDEQQEDVMARKRSLHFRSILWSQQRSKSDFSIGLCSRQRFRNFWSGGTSRRACEVLPKKEEEACTKAEEKGKVDLHSMRIRSMPNINSIEEGAQT